MLITRKNQSISITRKSKVAYRCTLRRYPDTGTFFMTTESPSISRTSNAAWVQSATSTADLPESLVGRGWLLFYQSHQFWSWVALIGLVVGVLSLFGLLEVW